MTNIYRTPGSGPKLEGRAIAMTPGEHYVIAEGLLEELVNGMEDGSLAEAIEGANVDHGLATVANLVAIAQVHATLANVDPNRTWPRRYVTDSIPERI